jgi:GNAT superfamily N-acetyltransferase
MPTELDIHPASAQEREAAHRNVFDIWSKGLSLADHLRYRLDSPSHSRAAWYVGTVQGQVVVSLGCYPLAFRLRGADVPGIAIGSVYTRSEFRGQGFAPRLLAWVEDHERQRRKAAISVLYSDIEPDYYARLGYTLCPSLEGWRDPLHSPPVAPELHLKSMSPADHLPAIMRLYADYHGAAPLSIARDPDYWAALLKKYADDRFYALTDASGAWRGYLRVGRKTDTWRITDFALAEQSEELVEELYGAFLELARVGGAHRVGGWLPDSPTARRLFQLSPRKTEITMIKPLIPAVTFDEPLVAGTSRFCEIDHV